MAEDLKARWTSKQWRTAAETWIVEALHAGGLRVTGAIEQPRVRFWSTQLTAPTDAGLFWFKANNPNQAFEASLIVEMGKLSPDHTVHPQAIEPGQGWLLSPDQGPTMYAADATGRDVWTRMVREFADLQRQLVGHEGRLLATGLPRLGPTEVASFVESSLERGRARPSSDPRCVDASLSARVLEILPRLADHAQLLESGPVPCSLEHNDLHNNNAFVAQTALPLRFFDFGDALWAHPFSSMCVPIEHMCDAWQVGPDNPDVQYVLDAYLEVWSDLASHDDLRTLMRSALPLGQAHRLLSWERVLPYADEVDLADYGGAIAGWLSRLVDEMT